MSNGYICLAKISDINLAKVAAARLRSEGVATRLHGEAMGPFPVTIGGLAETKLLVVADKRAEAVEILDDLGIDCEPPD